MSNIRKIEIRWIENFRKSPLINKVSGSSQSRYAYQLFYGRQDASYPLDYPHNFSEFYHSYSGADMDWVIDHLLEFLHFTGIAIRKASIVNHLSKYPED